MLVAGCAWAQAPVNDSVPAIGSDGEENVIGGRVLRSNQSHEVNIIGAPVYYNRDGSVRAKGVRRGNFKPDQGYQRPRHHYKNTLRNSFSSFFAEVEGMAGDGDMALGFNFTYLPNRWGAYASAMYGIHDNYVSVGPAVRLSDYDSEFDWHLYTGVMFGHLVGGEIVIRVAAPKRYSDFCWTSASIGIAIENGRSFATLGLSLELAAIVALGSFLFY